MIFKNESDKSIVIRSLLMLTNGDIVLATKAIDKSKSLDDAIKYIFCHQGQLKYCNIENKNG